MVHIYIFSEGCVFVVFFAIILKVQMKTDQKKGMMTGARVHSGHSPEQACATNSFVIEHWIYEIITHSLSQTRSAQVDHLTVI